MCQYIMRARQKRRVEIIRLTSNNHMFFHLIPNQNIFSEEKAISKPNTHKQIDGSNRTTNI